MYLDCHEYFPGVYHIGDALGVHMTLIVPEGTGRALLFDSCNGLSDPGPLVAALLEKHGLGVEKLSLVISHAHRDHVFGARWFDSFYIHEDDVPLTAIYTTKDMRAGVLKKAIDRGVVPEGFDEDAFYRADYQRRIKPGIPSFAGIDIVHLPGHTPGSLVLFFPKYRLLLTADNWNPTTWLFFPEALWVEDYAKNMRTLLSIDFEYVLCSHSGSLMPGSRLRSYINGLTEEIFSGAVPAETPYPQYKTLLCHPEPETNFIFRGR
jgi:glyoxylase-like metal-dependent hydrolase (beta-lactamase superfamily II)